MDRVLPRSIGTWHWCEPSCGVLASNGNALIASRRLTCSATLRAAFALSRDEFARLLEELPLHLADMAQFSVATGLRQANITRLEWKQISLERQHLRVAALDHKNGRPHSVPLTEAAMRVLLRRKGEHQSHVFTYDGNPIVQVNTEAWRNAIQRADIVDFRWHDLRHTFATWHREAGTPTHELQRLGGWKTQSMVERYAHVAPEGLQVAAAGMDHYFTLPNLQIKEL
ncbi:MAG: site-specific integrase [Comamonadaceae bacterium]|nr:MAG: site-specific integrase [Comamonadaceae bacterium]